MSTTYTYDSGGVGSLPGGGDPDYDDIVDYEQATDIDMTGQGKIILDMYDSQNHEDVNNWIAGATNTDEDNHRQIQSAAGCATPWAGKEGTGANIVDITTASRRVFNINEGHFRLINVGMKIQSTPDPADDVYAVNVADPGVKIIGCVVFDSHNGCAGEYFAGFRSADDNTLFFRCLARDITTDDGDKGGGFQIGPGTGETIAVICCTARNCDRAGFNSYNSTGVAIAFSCYGDDSGDAFIEWNWDAPSDYNTADDWTADLNGVCGNSNNNTDLDSQLNSDGLPTEPLGYGRNPYNDVTGTITFDNFLYNGTLHDVLFEKDIQGNAWSWDTVDSTIDVGAAQYATTISIDALIQKTGIAQTVSLDALIQEQLSASVSIDSLLQELETKTISIDALIQAVNSGTISLDALLQITNDVTFSIDALLQEAKTGHVSLDAIIAIITSESVSLDALLQAVNSGSISLDALLQIAKTKVVSLDALVQADKSGTISLDALLQIPNDVTFSIDALLQEVKTGHVSLDAILVMMTAESVTLDALLQAVNTGSISLDALLQIAKTKTVSLDALVQAAKTGAISIDALISITLSESTSLDAVIQKILTNTISLDALLSLGFLESLYLDALIAIAQAGSLSLDAVIRQSGYVLEYRDEIRAPERTKAISVAGRLKAVNAPERTKSISVAGRLKTVTAPDRVKIISSN